MGGLQPSHGGAVHRAVEASDEKKALQRAYEESPMTCRFYRARVQRWQTTCSWQPDVRYRTTRVHHAAWRRGGRMAARGARPAAATWIDRTCTYRLPRSRVSVNEQALLRCIPPRDAR